MRPRVFPAEDANDQRVRGGPDRRFNEAAGIPRGRRNMPGTFEIDEVASMRPRVFPAEDLSKDKQS